MIQNVNISLVIFETIQHVKSSQLYLCHINIDKLTEKANILAYP